jgi:hypothetical protein
MAELHELIAAEYRTARIPGWVQALQGPNFPPPPIPEPLVAVADHTVSAAATIGPGAAHLAQTRPDRP